MPQGLPTHSRITARYPYYKRLDRSVRVEEKVENRKNKKKKKISWRKVLGFASLSLLIYFILALSLLSANALISDELFLTHSETLKVVSPGETAEFDFVIENSSYFKKEFHLKLAKNIPKGWIASFCDTQTCFYEETTYFLEGKRKESFKVKIDVPESSEKDLEGSATLLLFEDEELKESFKSIARAGLREALRIELKDTLELEVGRKYILKVENLGNVKDSYKIYLERLSSGWKAQLSHKKIEIEALQWKEIEVKLIPEKNAGDLGEMKVTVRSESNESIEEEVLLKTEFASVREFSLRVQDEYILKETGSYIEFEIDNEGNLPETFEVYLVSYPLEWRVEVLNSRKTIDPQESEKIMVFVEPKGNLKNTSLILSVSNSREFKNLNLKLSVETLQGRAILAEYFTATWCFVCKYGEAALERLVQEFPNLLVLNYHIEDNLTTEGSDKRAQGLYEIQANIVTAIFNGNKYANYSSGGEEVLYIKYKEKIEELQNLPLKVEISMSGSYIEDKVEVSARLKPLSPLGEYDVYFVVFRDNFSYQNSVKRWIVRETLGPFRVNLRDVVSLSQSFVIPQSPGNTGIGGVGVVVIIQDPFTKEIIASGVYNFG